MLSTLVSLHLITVSAISPNTTSVLPTVSVKSLASFTQAVPSATIGVVIAKDSLLPTDIKSSPTLFQSVSILSLCSVEASPTFFISFTACEPSAFIFTDSVANSKLGILLTSAKLSYSPYIYFGCIQSLTFF